jgi:hydrogenase nickel incorporation protein HypB
MQIDLKQPILDKNDKLAQSNRELFKEKKVFVLDLLASPGSGKTSTILATIEALRDEFNIAVIEGDSANQHGRCLSSGKRYDSSCSGCFRSGQS